ncbi:MAG: hypothetical protein BWK78_02930 [Thiotrichaceae bacterium IS1]|nr:MAG: hypothetical protein BWK78_02930 [Thiotrichaceae bacterium IS1]
MKDTLLHLLCCPICQGDLQIHATTNISSDDHVMEGHLQCSSCNAHYPIVRGIPRFVSNSASAEVSSTVEGFGYEWKHANPLIQNTQFVAAETFWTLFIQFKLIILRIPVVAPGDSVFVPVNLAQAR